MKAYLVFIPLFAILGLTIWVSYTAWSSMPGVEMGLAGNMAMILGVVVSLAVGCGLMALLFLSSRRGYDDAADFRTTAHWDTHEDGRQQG